MEQWWWVQFTPQHSYAVSVSYKETFAVETEVWQPLSRLLSQWPQELPVYVFTLKGSRLLFSITIHGRRSKSGKYQCSTEFILLIRRIISCFSEHVEYTKSGVKASGTAVNYIVSLFTFHINFIKMEDILLKCGLLIPTPSNMYELSKMNNWCVKNESYFTMLHKTSSMTTVVQLFKEAQLNKSTTIKQSCA